MPSRSIVADRPGSGTSATRASFGHLRVLDAAPLVIDAKADPEPLRSTAATFVRPTRRDTSAGGAGAAGRLRSAALLPLPSDDDLALGVVVAMWGAGLQRLSHDTRQAAELLSAEAGHMFQRLQETAALAHDAETDPLAGAREPAYLRSTLETLRDGDTVVFVDLDHFKSVNDRSVTRSATGRSARWRAVCNGRAPRSSCRRRYGGEEFALVLPNSGVQGCARRCSTGCAPAGPPADGHDVLGRHLGPRPGDDPHQTLRRADAAPTHREGDPQAGTCSRVGADVTVAGSGSHRGLPRDRRLPSPPLDRRTAGTVRVPAVDHERAVSPPTRPEVHRQLGSVLVARPRSSVEHSHDRAGADRSTRRGSPTGARADTGCDTLVHKAWPITSVETAGEALEHRAEVGCITAALGSEAVEQFGPRASRTVRPTRTPRRARGADGHGGGDFEHRSPHPVPTAPPRPGYRTRTVEVLCVRRWSKFLPALATDYHSVTA